LQSQQGRKRGKFKIFLGASAGVGKTFAMLSEGHEEQNRGVDVLVGYIETHKRAETEALLTGLPILPRGEIEYRGVKVPEFDLDGALAKHPQLILVDELAHTNAPNSRHPKRWQDVEELLDAGIDVFSTVNVQHLESLNDAVASITGVVVKETVPDAVIQSADEIEVVDIPPDALRQRLKEGKVYVPERIEHALEGFFKTGNLIALRELALRTAADRVDAQMQRFRSEQGIHGVWPTKERVLVCIAPNHLATRVVRAAARIGAASHAEMLAIYVESDRQKTRSEEARELARRALRLAETLGMETVSLSGHDIVAEILDFARRKNANLVVVGKPIKPRWREIVFGSVVDDLVRRSGEIDVHVLTAPPEESPISLRGSRAPDADQSYAGYIWTVVVVALCGGLSQLLSPRVEPTNLAMIFVLGTTVIASRFTAREAVLSSVLGVLVFDFFFVPPKGTFAVSDTQYVITFGVMLAVALLISRLTLRLKDEATNSANRERRTSALYALSRALARSRSKQQIGEAAVQEIGSVFAAEVAVLEPKDNALAAISKSTSGFEDEPSEEAAARWALEHDEAAGKGTDTLAGARGLYLPLRGAQGAVGILAFLPNDRNWPLPPEQRDLLDTFANATGLALERAQLAKESHQTRLMAESERMRNALLSSISHDLRTPLTSITGAASALVQQGAGELADTIFHESMRLNSQVQKLLDMTRLQSGEVEPHLEWSSLEEIVGSALARTKEILGDRQIQVDIPSDLPLMRLDPALIEKLFVNLLENEAVHAPEAGKIEIEAKLQTEIVRVTVSDNGPGIPRGQESSIFERFSLGPSAGKGLGLGLAICRAIMRLHGGTIWVQNRSTGGAEFHLEFRRPTTQPEVPVG
jgi:two-component system sensor histidine kinase KdpD